MASSVGTISPNSLEINVGNESSITWSTAKPQSITTSDQSVASISYTSMSSTSGTITVTGISAGTATITVEWAEGSSTCSVTVINDTQVIVAEQSLQDIADSIRTKLGTSDTYLPSEMSAAIDSISGEGSSGTENLTETKVTISPSNIVNKFYDISLNSSDNVVKVGIPTDSSSSNTQLILNSQIEVVKIDRKTSSSENLSIRVKFNNVPESSVILSVFSLNVLDFSFEQGTTNKDKVYNLFRRLLNFKAEEEIEISFSSSAGDSGYVTSSDIYYYLDRAFLAYFVENSTFIDSQITTFIEKYKYLFNYILNNKILTIPASTVTYADECFKSLGATSFQYNNDSSKKYHELIFNGNTVPFYDYSNNVVDPLFYNDDLLKQTFPYIKSFSLSSCQKLSATTHFTYDSTTNTTLVSGTGNTYGLLLPRLAKSNTPLYGQLRSSESIVFGPNISSFDYDSCDPLAVDSISFPSLVNFVFMQPQSMSVTLSNGGDSGKTYITKTPCWFYNPKSAPKTKPTFNIYTDNDTIKNFSYTSNATINIYPLSDWEGPLVS